jgi:hypothetical protein
MKRCPVVQFLKTCKPAGGEPFDDSLTAAMLAISPVHEAI